MRLIQLVLSLSFLMGLLISNPWERFASEKLTYSTSAQSDQVFKKDNVNENLLGPLFNIFVSPSHFIEIQKNIRTKEPVKSRGCLLSLVYSKNKYNRGPPA